MGGEGSGVGATGNVLENGDVDLDKTVGVHEFPLDLPELGFSLKQGEVLAVGDQVQVAFSKDSFGVGDKVAVGGERPEAFGEEG